jgi:hypothetical protein
MMQEANSERGNPYVTPGRPPTLRKSIVVFMDILGYKDRIKSAFENGSAEEELRKLRLALDDAYRYLKEEHKAQSEVTNWWEVRAFTDNIVIGFPLARDDDAFGEMFWSFTNIAAFQLEMVLAGFFLRGGIAVGDLYIDSEIVFGPALLEAYEAESCCARDPRIVLAASAEDYVARQLSRSSSVEDSPHFHTLLKDVDGQTFLDYLDETVLIAGDDDGPFYEILEEHKRMIEAKLDEYRSKPSVWSKYAWTAHYHNYFCDRHSFGESYKVEITKLGLKPRPLS